MNKCNQIQLLHWAAAVSTVNILKPRWSCSWTYEINKLLAGLNKHLNNIIFERTMKYNTSQPQNSTAKESRSTAHGQKVQSLHGLLTCSHVRHMSYNKWTRMWRSSKMWRHCQPARLPYEKKLDQLSPVCTGHPRHDLTVHHEIRMRSPSSNAIIIFIIIILLFLCSSYNLCMLYTTRSHNRGRRP